MRDHANTWCEIGKPDPVALSNLLRAAWYLGHADQLVTTLGKHGQQPQDAVMFVGQAFRPHAALPQWERAEPELADLWTRHENTARQTLRDTVTAAAVPLEHRTGIHGLYGTSIVEFVAGDLLIELKTGHFTSHMDLRTAIAQMIRYGTLAPQASTPTPRIGLYLARYGLLLTWHWDTLAMFLRGDRADLPPPTIGG